MSTRAQNTRDAALRRLSRVNTSITIAAVIATGVVADVVSHIPLAHARTTASVSSNVDRGTTSSSAGNTATTSSSTSDGASSSNSSTSSGGSSGSSGGSSSSSGGSSSSSSLSSASSSPSSSSSSGGYYSVSPVVSGGS